jgi:YegS/Rv2252/BmrU family lipid kinase
MSITFIINPKAGRGRAVKLWKRISAKAMFDYPDATIVLTEYPGHAKDIASEAVRTGSDLVISVGGDGTVHEILNGIAGKGCALGIIPSGSGNDLARTLGIDLDVETAYAMIRSGVKGTIDIGLAGSRYFINIGGVGFDAEVVADMNMNMKFLRGTMAYVASVLKKLVNYRPVRLRIDIDGKIIEKTVYICAVANGRFYGGGMMLAPRANIRDGLFDICIIEDLNKWEFLKTFPKVFSGTHVSHPKVSMHKGKHIVIEGPENLFIHADGEVFGNLPADFRIIPNGIDIIGLKG